MDGVSMNHYEKQLYSVFKTFDINNEEALDRSAVLELCDALQLEDRGATLVDTLFDGRPDRVTFTHFRNGLLSVLGGEGPSPAPSTRPAVSTPPQSDDDSSGREVAPKFTFGLKKYGRRSRPQRIDSNVSPRHRVASESRLDVERCKQRMKCKRSSSAMESRIDLRLEDEEAPKLDHEQRVDTDRALKLCQSLEMHGVNRKLIQQVFDSSKTDEMSLGEFFDRLNVSLQSTIDSSLDESNSDVSTCIDNDTVPSDVIVEAWERAGVQKPRRLLQELGFTIVAIEPRDLEQSLDEELQALGFPSEISEPRSLLLLAANTLSRLQIERIRSKFEMVVAERNKLRSDLSEANRRARMLAQDVDENHAQIEAELKNRMKAMELKHAEIARLAGDEAAAERERASRESSRLAADIARRADLEAQLRIDLATRTQRCQDLEERINECENRHNEIEREGARALEEARIAAQREAERAEREHAAAEQCAERLAELRGDNARLRDRVDELAAALEAAARAPRPSSAPSSPLTLNTLQRECSVEDGHIEMCRPSQEQLSELKMLSAENASCELCGGKWERVGALCAVLSGPDDELAQLRASHEAEISNLNAIITELEGSLDALRGEYERCEEYWAARLQRERDEQRAADELLAELADKVAAYERQFASASRVAPPALPALPETALEDQYAQLEAEMQQLREETDARLARQAEDLSQKSQRIEELQQCADQLQQQLQRPRPRPCTDLDVQRFQPTCGCGGATAGAALRARAARAERAAQRLHARLAAADLLVKDLYIENCRLAHLPHLPPLPPLPRLP
ncbi:blastoderm-specific protein 25D-like isoform X1 [Pieris napi]|uniref:blastoderm-specific protein 25D-like isoform X1 n=1 Tax=Pieris napi TaxID=78633 RepID=UPI001FB9E0E3|nr:blastoderm-specific protein 25D-like isoform X1 [Pieris napi]